MPCFTTALSFYDGYRHEVLPANLIQVLLFKHWSRGHDGTNHSSNVKIKPQIAQYNSVKPEIHGNKIL